MAGGGEENVTEIVINNEAHDFSLLLSSSKRDFLVRNNGDRVLFYSINFFFHWVIIDGCPFLKKLFLHLSVWLSKLFDGHVMWTFGFIHPTERIGWWDLWFSWENMICERGKEREEFMLTLFAGFIFLCNE